MSKLQMQLNCLLEPREMNLLKTVNCAMTQYELRYGDTGPNKDDEKYKALMEQVSAMDENLKSIIEDLIAEKQSMERFVENFSEWEENRKKCIARLKKIAKSLDQDRFIFNVLKLSGYLLSLTGANPDVSSNLAIAGDSLPVGGNAAVLGSSISETVRLKRKVKKARKLIEKDKKYFAGIRGRLHRAIEYHEALDSVLDISIMKDITGITRKLIDKATKIKDDPKRLKKFEKKGVKTIINAVRTSDYDIPIAAVVTVAKVCATVFLLMCTTENRLVCDFVALSAKSIAAVTLLVGHSRNMFGVASLIAADSAAVARVTLGVVGMVFDAVGIVKTSVDIYRNSRSPEGRKIFQAAENLRTEAGALYDACRAAQNFQSGEVL